MDNPIDKHVATALQSYTVLAIVALLIGATIAAPFAAGFVSSEPDRVAVVSVDELITGSTAQETVKQLRELRSDDSVKAVVLRISSRGGSAAASEKMYLAVNRLAEEKPVITSVGGYAASGAYYTASPSEEIYVTPASIVGHVGVIGTTPTDGLSSQATSGADKAHSGMTRDQYYASLESMKRAFVGAVMNERGDRLNVSRATVAEASAYHGGRAIQTGYADGIGGMETAIAAAAESAGISNYEVNYYNPAQPAGLGLLLGGSAESNATSGNAASQPHRGVESVHFLMIYGTPEGVEANSTTTARGVNADA